MATFVKYECFVEDLAEKKHNLGSDALKIALSNRAPVVGTDLTLTTATQISSGAGNGYTQGGTAPSITSSGQIGGTYKLVLADVVFTATASMGPFRYVILYNSAAGASDALIGYYDYGSSITLATGETFTVDFSDSTGVLTLA